MSADKRPLQRLTSAEAGIGPISVAPTAVRPMAPVVDFLQRTTAVWTCGLYMAISGSLILINRFIMIEDGFHFPLMVSFMGMLSSAILSFIVCKYYKINSTGDAVTLDVYIRKMVPIGFCMALTLYLGNVVYFYLSVSFIQMLKATTPIMVMVALFVTKLEKPTVPLIASVLVIATGTVIASAGQIDLSLFGLLIMLAAEMLEAIKLVLMQKLLVGMEFHPIEGLMYLAPACCFWLLLDVLVVEAAQIVQEGALRLILHKPFVYGSAALFGFFVNLTAYMVIQKTSSLMLKILGTVRNALIVFIATFVLHEIVTWPQYLGYGISLLGFHAYNKVKMAQTHAAAVAAAQQQQQELQSNNKRPGSILNVK